MKLHEDHAREFCEFLEWRQKDERNIGKSFTYWSAFYDFMVKRTRPRSERHEEWDMIQAFVCSFLDIPRATADILRPRALLEILSMDQLDEIARILYFNDHENATT